jgi:hypothetical protein
MTKRFLIWFFWYLLISVPLALQYRESLASRPWLMVLWAVLWWAGLVAWWGTFLYRKYKDRGRVRFAVWGAYGLLSLLILLAQFRGLIT